MAEIRFIREYQIVPGVTETLYDIVYKSGKLYCYTAEDLPGTAKAWLKDKVGKVQYDRTLEREEVIYKAETMYRVEFDFYAGDKEVHAYLDNNGNGFCREDAVYIGKQLVAQGNTHVMVIAI